MYYFKLIPVIFPVMRSIMQPVNGSYADATSNIVVHLDEVITYDGSYITYGD